MSSQAPKTGVSPAGGGSVDRLVIRKPDDWHVHLRDGPMLAAVVNFTARQFGRAIVMPNLNPPVTTAAAAQAYRERILAALSPDVSFMPLMTCYLTDGIDPAEVERGFKEGAFTACKLYPAHATTNSQHGVTDIRNIYPVLEAMQRIGMPLLLHGEVTDKHVDVFDREAVFIERTLSRLVIDFPALKVVFEHITTADAVAFVEGASPHVAATITPHHLEYNRNAMFDGGMRPHFYCLPVAKREHHRLAGLSIARLVVRRGEFVPDGLHRGQRERVRDRLALRLTYASMACVTSDPVPAVVGTAIGGGPCLGIGLGTL